MRLEFADSEISGEQRLDLAIFPLHLSTTELTMSTSKTPPDIIQEGEKNPRGIPKALFIVRSLFVVFWPFLHPALSSSFALSTIHYR